MYVYGGRKSVLTIADGFAVSWAPRWYHLLPDLTFHRPSWWPVEISNQSYCLKNESSTTVKNKNKQNTTHTHTHTHTHTQTKPNPTPQKKPQTKQLNIWTRWKIKPKQKLWSRRVEDLQNHHRQHIHIKWY